MIQSFTTCCLIHLTHSSQCHSTIHYLLPDLFYTLIAMLYDSIIHYMLLDLFYTLIAMPYDSIIHYMLLDLFYTLTAMPFNHSLPVARFILYIHRTDIQPFTTCCLIYFIHSPQCHSIIHYLLLDLFYTFIVLIFNHSLPVA